MGGGLRWMAITVDFNRANESFDDENYNRLAVTPAEEGAC